MRKILIIFILVPSLSLAQSTVSLDSCMGWALDKFSFQLDKDGLEKMRELSNLNISTAKLPQFIVSGSTTWQNEQLEISLGVPGISGPEVPLNFNRLLLNFNQTIYDGQLTRHKAHLNDLEYAAKQTEVDVEIMKLKAQVAGIFFGVLLAEESLGVLEEQRQIFVKRKDQLIAARANGLVLPSAIKILDAEIIGLDQKVVELNSTGTKLRLALVELTGHDVTSWEFLTPAFDDNLGTELNRPELNLLDLKIEVLEEQKSLTIAMRQPKVNFFGNAGLGDPGFNILNESIRPMLYVGVKVDWMPWDWKRNQNSLAILGHSQVLLKNVRQRAQTQFETALARSGEEIQKYDKLIGNDEILESIRKSVADELSVQLLNGSASASEYSVALVQSSAAQMNKALHQLQKMLAQLNYQIIQGEF